MGVEEDDAGDSRGGEAGGEEVDDENARGDEDGGASGVEGEAVVGGEVGGDFGTRSTQFGVRALILQGREDGGFEGRGRGEEEEGALGRVVEEEEGADELVEAEAGGEDNQAAGRVL